MLPAQGFQTYGTTLLRYLSRTIGRRTLSVARVCVPVPLSSVVEKARGPRNHSQPVLPIFPDHLCFLPNLSLKFLGYLRSMSKGGSSDFCDRFVLYEEESRARLRMDSGADRHLFNDWRGRETTPNPASISQIEYPSSTLQGGETSAKLDFHYPSDYYNVRLLIINSYVYLSLMK